MKRKPSARNAGCLAACVLASVLVVGCKDDPPPAPAKTPTVDLAAEARALCHDAPPAGDAAADREHARLVEAARAAPDGLGPGPHVLAGLEHVKKARRASDDTWYARAEACAEVALSLDEDTPGALNLQALAALNDHRFEDARDRARAVLERKPKNTVALGALSDALLELGDLEGATDAAQRMLDERPSLPSYSRASFLMWARGDGVGAKKLIQQAFAAGRDPKDPEPRAWVVSEAAKIFFHEGDYKGAEAGFDMALQTLPRYPPALLGKARCRAALGKPAEGIPLVQAALAQRRDAESVLLLGQLQRAASQTDAAAATFAELVTKHRRDALTVGRHLAYRGADLDEATRLLRREHAQRPQPWVTSALAYARYRAGDVDEARALMAKVPATIPDAQLMFERGVVLGDAALAAKARALNPAYFTLHRPEPS